MTVNYLDVAKEFYKSISHNQYPPYLLYNFDKSLILKEKLNFLPELIEVASKEYAYFGINKKTFLNYEDSVEFGSQHIDALRYIAYRKAKVKGTNSFDYLNNLPHIKKLNIELDDFVDAMFDTSDNEDERHDNFEEVCNGLTIFWLVDFSKAFKKWADENGHIDNNFADFIKK